MSGLSINETASERMQHQQDRNLFQTREDKRKGKNVLQERLGRAAVYINETNAGVETIWASSLALGWAPSEVPMQERGSSVGTGRMAERRREA